MTFGESLEFTTGVDGETEEAVDPETVVCTVRSPAGTNTEPEVTKAESGVYTAEFELTESGVSGLWHYAFDGTGGSQASAEGTIRVRRRKVAR